MKAVRVLFLTIRDDNLIRIDRFILLQKGEHRRYYKSQDRYYDIRKDENTIAVWYTEERYQKIMTFWYAAHGKEYRGSEGTVAAWSRTGDSFKESE